MSPDQIFSGFNLSLDHGIAAQLGVHAALIFNHIVYWLKLNARKPDFVMVDGKYWMYETQQQMADFFEFIDEEAVTKAIKKLKDSGLIESRNMSKNPFDRTLSYTVYDQDLIKKSLRNPEISGMHTRKLAESETRKLAECIYNDTTEEKQKKQQHAAAGSLKKPKQKTQSGPVIHPYMRGLDPNLVPLEDQIWICANYSEEIVEQAMKWAKHPETKLNKSLAAAIKWACKEKPEIPKTKETDYEKVRKVFTHCDVYNGATCYLTPEYIAFERGMKNECVKFDAFFTMKKLKELCKSFQLVLPKDFK